MEGEIKYATNQKCPAMLNLWTVLTPWRKNLSGGISIKTKLILDPGFCDENAQNSSKASQFGGKVPVVEMYYKLQPSMFGLISFLDRALVPYLPPRIGSVPWLAKSRPYKLSPSRIFCLHCSLGASWRTQSLTQGRGELGPGLLKQNVHITQENAVFLTTTKEGGRHNAFTQVCLLKQLHKNFLTKFNTILIRGVLAHRFWLPKVKKIVFRP